MLSIHLTATCFDKQGYNHLLVSTQQQKAHRGPHAYKSEFIMIIIIIIVIREHHRQHCSSIHYWFVMFINGSMGLNIDATDITVLWSQF